MDVVPPGDADVKNKEENIFRPQDKPAASPKEVAEDWDYAPFQELLQTVVFMAEEHWT